MVEDIDGEKYGRLISNETFFGTSIRLYSKGFVRVGSTRNAPYEKLLGISGSADVSKKTAIGRGIVAGMTMGTNLLVSPNKRGDVYLTIVTDRKTHALHQSPPGLKDIQVMHNLVAAGEAILKGQSSNSYIQPIESRSLEEKNSAITGVVLADLLSSLQKLGDLHAAGVVSDDEFTQLKEQIMGGKSTVPIKQDGLPVEHEDPQEKTPSDHPPVFDVVLKKTPNAMSMKIELVKEFRSLHSEKSLKEAKIAIDNPPTIIARSIPFEQSQEVARRIESFGAEVEIVSSIFASDKGMEEISSSKDVKTKHEFPKYKPSLPKDRAEVELSKLMANRAFERYKGYNGSVTLFNDRIEVQREGVVAKITHEAGIRAIDLTSIFAVHQKAATVFVNGYIKFFVLGDSNSNDQKILATDKNAILFTYQHRKEQAELFAILEQVSNIAIAPVTEVEND